MQRMKFTFDSRQSDSAVVEYIWRTQSESAGVFTSLAEYHSEMVVTRYQGRTTFTVRGPETQATQADVPAEAEFFGIVLRPGTFMPHLPPSVLMNRKDVTLPEATNQSFWLLGSAWSIPSFENADTFVNRLVRDGLLVHDPIVDSVLQGHPSELSLRALQYRFRLATGLTHKIIRQIVRAKRAAALLEQGMSILDTVYEVGYFDQPHLTRALQRFFGQTPTQLIRARKPE
jgi:hypothetical protein